MCQFCIRHGEGEKWYLNVQNYAEDLLSDVRRRVAIADWFTDPKHLSEKRDQMQRFATAPSFVRRAVGGVVTRHMKNEHFGQVVPLEDLRRIFSFVTSIVRIPCLCRHVTFGREARYCYGISVGANRVFNNLVRDLDQGFVLGPDNSEFEELSAEGALEAFEDHEREGLCHTVWAFVPPFVGGICNCDQVGCVAMQATVAHDLKVLFRAEYVAQVDPGLCNGCRSCTRVCQFGALVHNGADQKASVDQQACYGCGICRRACDRDAITLKPRADVPAAAGKW